MCVCVCEREGESIEYGEGIANTPHTHSHSQTRTLTCFSGRVPASFILANSSNVTRLSSNSDSKSRCINTQPKSRQRSVWLFGCLVVLYSLTDASHGEGDANGISSHCKAKVRQLDVRHNLACCCLLKKKQKGAVAKVGSRGKMKHSKNGCGMGVVASRSPLCVLGRALQRCSRVVLALLCAFPLLFVLVEK